MFSASCPCGIWLATVRSGRGRFFFFFFFFASLSPPPSERVKGQPETSNPPLLPIKRDSADHRVSTQCWFIQFSNFENKRKLSLILDHCFMCSCRAYKVKNYNYYYYSVALCDVTCMQMVT